MSKIELLAPVGHKEGLVAAVTNGADAIYVGGAAFGARKEAAFTHEELIEVISYAHLHHVKVYVTVNTTIFDEEIEPLKEYIHFLYTHDVDAIIVQDIGVANLVRTLYPDFELHFSTQMTLHNTEGVKFAKDFGADRVVVARENTLEDIKAMNKAVDIDLEVFVHGAICVSYSGQCLMSSVIGARSGNRGSCAQTCRLPYELVNLKNNQVIHSEVGSYLLSPRDLNTIHEVGELIEAGVTSFKIEGRLKRPEYVATVISAYRRAIDSYLETKKVDVTKQTSFDMLQIFNRGFTKGYLFNETGMSLMSPDRPNNKGIQLGEVINVSKKRVTVKLNGPLSVGDGLRFVSAHSDKDQGLQVQKMFVKKQDVKLAPKGLVEFEVNFKPEVGMKVYKTLSVELNERVTTTEKEVPKIQIYGEVTGKLNEPLTLMVWDDESNMVTLSSEQVFEVAQKTALTSERLKEQLQKTGSTPFAFSYLNVSLEEGITFPISQVNAMRRDILEQLQQKRQVYYTDRDITATKTEMTIERATVKEESELSISVRNFKQLQSIIDHPSVHRIYYKDIKTLTKALEVAKAANKQLIPQFDRIMDDESIASAKAAITANDVKTVMLSEWGMWQAVKDLDLTLLADFAYNMNNVYSLQTLKEMGYEQATLSYEVNQRQIRGLLKETPLPLEAIVFTRIPMMIMKHCPVKMLNSPNDDFCRLCLSTPFGLKDRKNKVMPLLRTGNCLTEIFNAQHLILIEYISDLKRQGVRSFRLEFTSETEAEILAAIEAYTNAIYRDRVNQPWLDAYKDSQDYTKGHYQRGVN